jgi:hypothetical protein
MSRPIRATDTAVRVNAQSRIRDASSSARCGENFTATAPATVPSSVIGAMISQ